VTLTSYDDSLSMKIPKLPGLYAFYLDLISPAKLGLLGREGFSDDQLERAKKDLVKRVRKSIDLLHKIRMLGGLKIIDKKAHYPFRFKLLAEQVPSLDYISQIEALPTDSVYGYLQAVHEFALFAQPIYVGITKEQTLFQRYFQHKQDFEVSEERSKFGVRLRHAGIDWDDILFVCVEFKSPSKTVQILTTLEKHLQNISNPALSIS
jgi:hypothetical protein